MYFSENLEYCTMTDVSFCEDGVDMERERRKTPFSLKNFIAGITCPTPGASCIPRRWIPQPQRTRTDCTAQAATQAVPDARQTAHNRPCTDTHARTLDTLHRSAPDTRQAAPGRSGRRRGLEGLQCVRQSVQFRTFIFIHIYMDIFCQKH